MSSVRPMTARDLDAVRRVELGAGERFRSLQDARLARCADDEPFAAAELLGYIGAGRAWVAVDGGAVAGFVVVDLVDGFAHVEEIAVATEFGQRGHGAALLAEVDRWASSAGVAALTLTTFRDVPWNAPWYRALGFRVLEEDEWTEGLRRRRATEDAHGLPADLRVIMRRELGSVGRRDPTPSRYVVPPSARHRR
jgi:ribosomal protein S18 acetylase RimI-like enzyme